MGAGTSSISTRGSAAAGAWRRVAVYMLCVPKDFRESATVDPLAWEEYGALAFLPLLLLLPLLFDAAEGREP